MPVKEEVGGRCVRGEAKAGGAYAMKCEKRVNNTVRIDMCFIVSPAPCCFHVAYFQML